MFKALAIAIVLVTGAAALQAQESKSPEAKAPPVKRTVLQKAEVPGTNLELIFATVEIAPGFKAGRHSHPGVVMAQIVEGEFWFHPDGGAERVYRAGETLTVPAGLVHNEGATDKGVKLIAVYALEKGKPIAIPAK